LRLPNNRACFSGFYIHPIIGLLVAKDNIR
jgi:hypothetical protein